MSKTVPQLPYSSKEQKHSFLRRPSIKIIHLYLYFNFYYYSKQFLKYLVSSAFELSEKALYKLFIIIIIIIIIIGVC